MCNRLISVVRGVHFLGNSLVVDGDDAGRLLSHMLVHWVAGTTRSLGPRSGQAVATGDNRVHGARLMEYLSSRIRCPALNPCRRARFFDTWVVVQARLGFDTPPFALIEEGWETFKLCSGLGGSCRGSNPSACWHG